MSLRKKCRIEEPYYFMIFLDPICICLGIGYIVIESPESDDLEFKTARFPSTYRLSINLICVNIFSIKIFFFNFNYASII